MKLKNLVVFALLGAGVGYGGVKGYIHYKVKKQVDRLTTLAAPFAYIEYRSIGSDLQGRVMINDLVVYPRGVNDAVKADQLRVTTPGLEFLLTGADSVKRGELPERMGVALQGARLNLNGRLAKVLEQAEATQLGQQPTGSIACRLGNRFITAKYRELGLEELVFDTEFSFERGVTASQLVLKMAYSIRDTEQAEFTMTLNGFGDSLMSLAVARPQLGSVKMNFRPDAEFARKTLEYCATKQGVELQTFVNGLFEKSDAQYMQDLGFVPGPGIRAAMKELMQHAGELSLVAQPTSTLDVKTVHLYKPEDWPDLFGLVVKVNGKEVSDLSFSMPGIDHTKQGDKQSAAFSLPAIDFLNQKEELPALGTTKTQKTSRVMRSSSARPRYRTVTRSEVSMLPGREVRISTVDGKRRSGRVIGVKNGVISLEMRMHGGTLSTRVPVATAGKIEVLEHG